MQLDMGYKGFSFSKEGPLDMRMGPDCVLTAEEIVNRWSEQELGHLFRDYGEESQWKLAAKTIVAARQKEPIKTTKQLAELLENAFKGRGKMHPATLIFQALRIAVNQELDSVFSGLRKAIHHLAPQGKIGVISFHSLEDRIVKNVFKEASATVSKREAKQGKFSSPLLRLLTKKPVVPTFAEIRFNFRARSAKLRFAERV